MRLENATLPIPMPRFVVIELVVSELCRGSGAGGRGGHRPPKIHVGGALPPIFDWHLNYRQAVTAKYMINPRRACAARVYGG